MMLFLHEKWEFAQSEPGVVSSPVDLATAKLNWLSAIVPGTVAQSLQAHHVWQLDDKRNLDDHDWWYRCEFSADTDAASQLLKFNGLATLADVWLNGELILQSTNMFVHYNVDVSRYLASHNELCICFRAINQALKEKRPRPKWKTKLVANQQLRWIRTSLLGRIPGWAGGPAAVGPWRSIQLLNSYEIDIDTIDINSYVTETTGNVEIAFIRENSSADDIKAELCVGEQCIELAIKQTGADIQISGHLTIDDVKRWWPHTHGEPCLYRCELNIEFAGDKLVYELPSVGFNTVEIKDAENNFALEVNDLTVFCRGACWTCNDIISLSGSLHSLEHTLMLMRDAGANMIRIGGTMIYEQERFYQLCDELGIMVWQDFMFANMDYPVEDESFSGNVSREIQQTTRRLNKHICVSVYCGNSEIEQQAAMLGMDKPLWRSELFSQLIPDLCQQHKNIPYVASSPTGEPLPFHVNKGLSHYYGVGAYLRSQQEVRQHDVKFTSECLGFANVPVSKTRNTVLDGQIPVTHDPRWKARTPRDTGTGWDFEDVRDHYLKTTYAVDPVMLRSFDPERYMRLSETTTGEVMAQVFAEWRSTHSQCQGGLVWFLQDLWPGAGWGILDSNDIPKACYYYLKRCWQPVSVHMTNESINGIDIHICNDSPQSASGKLELSLLHAEKITIANSSIEFHVPARSTQTYKADEVLGAFYDVSYAYRFGPVKHDVVMARLLSDSDTVLCETYLFPRAKEPALDAAICVQAVATQLEDNEFQLAITSDKFLYAVNIDVPGFIADDNFFHVMPDTQVNVKIHRLHDTTTSTRFKGYVSALNIVDDVKIKINK